MKRDLLIGTEECWLAWHLAPQKIRDPRRFKFEEGPRTFKFHKKRTLQDMIDEENMAEGIDAFDDIIDTLPYDEDDDQYGAYIQATIEHKMQALIENE